MPLDELQDCNCAARGCVVIRSVFVFFLCHFSRAATNMERKLDVLDVRIVRDIATQQQMAKKLGDLFGDRRSMRGATMRSSIQIAEWGYRTASWPPPTLQRSFKWIIMIDAERRRFSSSAGPLPSHVPSWEMTNQFAMKSLVMGRINPVMPDRYSEITLLDRLVTIRSRL
jgi:hypothetical protein